MLAYSRLVFLNFERVVLGFYILMHKLARVGAGRILQSAESSWSRYWAEVCHVYLHDV